VIGGDPLLDNHPLWSGHTSTPLFEREGLALSYEYVLAVAGIVSIDGMPGVAVGGPATLDFESLQGRWPLLPSFVGARAAYERVCEVVSSLALPDRLYTGQFLSPIDVDAGQ
jgi:hypothetical protein